MTDHLNERIAQLETREVRNYDVMMRLSDTVQEMGKEISKSNHDLSVNVEKLAQGLGNFQQVTSLQLSMIADQQAEQKQKLETQKTDIDRLGKKLRDVEEKSRDLDQGVKDVNARIDNAKDTIFTGARIFWAVFGSLFLTGTGFLLSLYFGG